ncbi:hypothetical protein ACIA8K_25130 [Catenuloplanes sp. NPDC051500]|uniref:hypothetical protein n=1 Tax=Catenuloplanes sp. NPDC051500 TaxID=3363959 RepID=UPI0037A169F4
MDTPDSTARQGALRTFLRRVVFGAALIVATLIAVFVGQAVLSAAGLTSDPHGYDIIFGILFATVLTPVALVLWLVYRSLR